jgi:cold shock CspA family protein
MSSTKTGRVKMTGPSFGFLTCDDGSGDVFIHASVWERAGLSLSKGDDVTFAVEPTDRGPRAVSIAPAS